MKTYELINPSDKITLKAKSHKIATACCFITGRGQYGLECLDQEWSLPIFIFGGAVEHYKEEFKSDFDKDLEDKEFNLELIHTLSSFKLKGERTSINNICKNAHSYAKALQKKYGDKDVK